MSNDATLAPARKASKAKAPKATPPSTNWRDLALTARDKTSALLDSIVAVEDHGGNVEVFWRLTNMASAMMAGIAVETEAMEDVETCANNVMALITGALNAPDEQPQDSSREVLRIAHETLRKFTNCCAITGKPGADEVADFRRAVEKADGVSLSGQPADPIITRDTELPHGGQPALDLALDCSYDIEPIANLLINLADDLRGCSAIDQIPSPALFRMLGCRVKELNSVIMSYLSDDNISLDDAHRSYAHGAINLPKGELQ